MKRPSIVKETRVKIRDYVFFVCPAEARTEYGLLNRGGTVFATPTKRTGDDWLVYTWNRECAGLLTRYSNDEWGVSKVAKRDGSRFEIRASIRTAPTFEAALDLLTR